MKVVQTECYEKLTHKIQTPGNYPEESIQHSEQGESWNKDLNLTRNFLKKNKIYYLTKINNKNIDFGKKVRKSYY